MNIESPELRPTKLLLWSITAALLRGDRDAATLLATDATEPTMTEVAAETLAEVLRVHGLVADVHPRKLQQWVTGVLAELAVSPGPDLPATSSTQHLGQPDWLPSA